MKLKDLISYEEGSISNLDVASTDTMKFVLMAFDKGTGLTPHRYRLETYLCHLYRSVITELVF